MGIDLLDIVFRLEKTFSITIDREDLVPDFIINDRQGKYVVDGKLTVQGLDEVKRRMPSADLSSFAKNPVIVELATILTVRTLCDLVEQKIREKNEGTNAFPNVWLQVNNFVPEILSKQFNIADTSKIERKLRLEQLADLSDPPLSALFWRRFLTICRGDPNELKAIKAYVLSRELVSVWKTLFLSLGITTACCLWFGIWTDIWTIFVLLFVPAIILFGLRSIVNRVNRRKASRVTVGEIIDNLVDQRSDRSVRADGLPYSRTEIEQGVAEALCKSLAVKPEEIKPEARIYNDLGAA